MRVLIAKFISFIFFFIILTGCVNLEVDNPNNPDYTETVTTPSNAQEMASRLVNLWFRTTHDFSSPAIGFWVAADAGTMSWGTAGSRYFAYEPRVAFDNTTDFVYNFVNEDFYKNLHALLEEANNILSFVANGEQILINEKDETDMVSAVAYFAQGLALGYLGLVYDRGFVITHETSIEDGVELSPFSQLINAALGSFEEVIYICNNSEFIIPVSWIPLEIELSNTNFAKLANSFSARILAYSPRTKEQNDAIDWQKVLDYASNGIDYDFSPIADDVIWYSQYHTYANYVGWGQTDMRIVNIMDPRMPSRWPGEDGFNWISENVGSPITDINDPSIYDFRIVTDFMPLYSCPFNPDRGYYYFSNYRFKRRDNYLTSGIGSCPDFYRTENDLIKAEALLYLNRLAEAKEIIDNGTRVTRGGLPAVEQTEQAIAEAIFHERNVELMSSGFGIEFFTMRKADMLQQGNFLHLPIPGAELELIKLPYYTFGAEFGVPGVDVSIGGWF